MRTASASQIFSFFQIAHRRGIAPFLYVLTEEGQILELLVRLDDNTLRRQVLRGADEAAVEGGASQTTR
jgi:hypothetical protein